MMVFGSGFLVYWCRYHFIWVVFSQLPYIPSELCSCTMYCLYSSLGWGFNEHPWDSGNTEWVFWNRLQVLPRRFLQGDHFSQLAVLGLSADLTGKLSSSCRRVFCQYPLLFAGPQYIWGWCSFDATDVVALMAQWGSFMEDSDWTRPDDNFHSSPCMGAFGLQVWARAMGLTWLTLSCHPNVRSHKVVAHCRYPDKENRDWQGYWGFGSILRDCGGRRYVGIGRDLPKIRSLSSSYA